jgi:hypothetical protein
LERRIEEYSWLEDLGRDIKKIEAALAEVGRKQELRDKLTGLREEIVTQEEVAEDTGDIILALERIIDHAGGLLTGIEAKAATRQKLAATCSNIATQKNILSVAENILAATERTAEGQEILSRTEQDHARNRKLVSLEGQIIESWRKLDTIWKVVAATETIPEIAAILTITTGKVGKLTTLKKLYQDVQGEETRLSFARNILDATRTLQRAVEALESISRMNHTRNIFSGLLTGILKAEDDILRYDEILSLTAGTNQGKEILSQVEAGIPKVKKLRELAGEISSWILDLDRAEAVLAATERVGRGNEVLAQVEQAGKQKGRLVELQTAIAGAMTELNRAGELVLAETRNIEMATKEYRKLLLEAGICEGCKVVGEVLAAVG